MGTITVCIDDATEQRFREVARRKLGNKKGSLGRATTEAFELWVQKQTQEEIARSALALLEQGFDFGRYTYRKREDLYDDRTSSC